MTLLYDPPSPHPYLQPVEEIYFTVLEVDLDMDGVDDSSQKTEEIVPGGFIALNQDDDDNNESADKGQSGPITGEDNLVMITLNEVSPTNLTGYVTLTASTKVKIWGSATKGGSAITLPKTYSTPSDLPKTLWLEGFDNSSSVRDAGLTLEYSIGGTTFDDIIKLTVVKVDVEVAGSDNDTEEIPSVKPASKVPDDHFVTVKGSGNIGLWATTVPDDIEVDETISWTGITQHPDENLYAYKSRASSGKFANVRVNVCGRDAKDLTNWVVWSTGSSSANPINEDVQWTKTSISGGYDVTHTITPADIITQSDRPDLSGSNNSSPPNVPAGDTNVANKGVSLAGGADMKWDSSRQIRRNVLNPDNINFSAHPDITKYTTYLNYPSDGVCGNDDVGTADEDNDPYSAPNAGAVYGIDNPKRSPYHSEGNLNNTFEIRNHMRAFARLELGGTWYRISDWYLWKTHFKFKKQNESEATWNKDFNGDGDKFDIVPVWRDNGSFIGLNNSGF